MLLYYVLQHTTIPHTPEQKRTTAHAYNTHFTERSGNISLPTRTVEDYAVAVRVQPTEASEEDEHGGVDPMVGQRVLQGGCAAGHVNRMLRCVNMLFIGVNRLFITCRVGARQVMFRKTTSLSPYVATQLPYLRGKGTHKHLYSLVYIALHTHGVLLHTY